MRVAVIGAGKFGKNHVRIIKELRHEVYVSDSDKDREIEISNEFAVKVLKGGDPVDAVVIVTPSDTHYNIVKSWLRKGVHVFCEKPLCFKSDQAWELVDLADSMKAFFGVGHVFRFTDGALMLKRLLPILKPTQITMNFMNDKPARSDSDILFNLAIHFLDMLDMVNLGKPVIDNYSKEENYGHIRLKYPREYGRDNDIEVLINVSCNSTKTRSIIMKNDFSETKINLMKSSNEPLKDELKHFFDCVESGVHPTNFADIKVIKLLEGFK